MRHTALFMIALTLRAESAPDALTLLKRSDHAMESYSTFRYQWRSVSKGDGPEGPRLRAVDSGSVSGRSDGKSRIESSTGYAVTSDGRVAWTYDRRRNFYDSLGFLGHRLQVLRQIGVADVTMLYLNPVGGVREEKIDVDGMARDCWVVTTAAPSPWDHQATTWIDKELWIDWRVETKHHITVPEKLDLEITLEKFNLEFGPDLPDSLFTFTPPPGSKQFCCRDEYLVH
jgi:outer membrane lipoprotein-sorting protein